MSLCCLSLHFKSLFTPQHSTGHVGKQRERRGGEGRGGEGRGGEGKGREGEGREREEKKEEGSLMSTVREEN